MTMDSKSQPNQNKQIQANQTQSNFGVSVHQKKYKTFVNREILTIARKK